VPDALVDQVGRLLRRAARTAVLPLFQHLAVDDIEEKAPGELVTVADRESERIIAAGLLDLLPGSTVVGEEAVAATGWATPGRCGLSIRSTGRPTSPPGTGRS
jgi:fructose-1,6-bisphosphatase/inositol monophosphatase family enzyme